jgi:2-methylaconitate cis-trans-isomerase PrpF
VIDYTGNCGNTSAAVGPFALLRDLIKPVEPVTKVRIYNTNTKKVILAEFEVRDGQFVSEGDFCIDGAPGTGSKILLDFIGSGGSVTGKLLPTGKVREEVKFPTLGTLEVSMVDAANPFVVPPPGPARQRWTSSATTKTSRSAGDPRRVSGNHGHRQGRQYAKAGVPKIAVIAGPASYDTQKAVELHKLMSSRA